MKLKLNIHAILCTFGLLALCVATAAQDPAPPPSAPPKRSAAELEKLVAPIALHPDPLISIILPASVYPLEIVQAARFVKDTNNIAKVDAQAWDANVKSVAKFPAVIAQMDADLTWTTALGEAFIEQQEDLIGTIQTLRAKANTAGVLKTTPQQIIVVTNTVTEKTIEQRVVFVTNTVVQIQPSNPQVVYVPTYPPTIYYPPPVYTGPPPILTFAAGVAVGAIIANNVDWHGGGIYVGGSGFVAWGGGGGGNYNAGGNTKIKIEGDVNIGNGNNNNVGSGNRPAQQPSNAQKWQPDQGRVKSSGSTTSAKTMESRGYGSGSANAAARPSTQPATANRGGGATASTRPSTPSAGTAGTRPSTPSAAARPSTSPSARPSGGSPSAGNMGASARPSAAPTASRSSAFGGGDRQASQRGAASRGGGGGASRGGGGGGGSRGGGGR